MRKTLLLLDRIGRTLENIALVALFSTMMLLAIGQIALRELSDIEFFRNLFGSGAVWVDGLVKLIVFWLAMIAAIAAARDDRHIRIDALSHVLPDRAVDVIRIVVDVFAAAVCGALVWYSYQLVRAEFEWETAVLSNTPVEMPAWAAHAMLPVGFGLICYRFLILAATRIYEMVRGVPVAESAE